VLSGALTVDRAVEGGRWARARSARANGPKEHRLWVIAARWYLRANVRLGPGFPSSAPTGVAAWSIALGKPLYYSRCARLRTFLSTQGLRSFQLKACVPPGSK
jgi:hypothetical protein